jgi:hypothetical protein
MLLKPFLLVATVSLAFVPQAAHAKYVSGPQCAAWFKKLDRNGDGALGTNEGAGRYYDKITLGGTGRAGDSQFIMQRSFFLAECRVGSFGMPR